jgi:uncharacterized membrane protein
MGSISGSNPFSQTVGASFDGQVLVGTARTSQTQSTMRDTPFKWTQATGMFALPGLVAPSQGEATAVTPDGTIIVGGSYEGVNSNPRAVRWTNSGVASLGQLPSLNYYLSRAHCVSHDGSVVGGVQYLNHLGSLHGFRWTAATGMQSIGSMCPVSDMSSDGSILVGRNLQTSPPLAIIWDTTNGLQDLNVVAAARGVNLAGWTLRHATGITPDGHTIVGEGTNPSGQTEAYILHLPPPVLCGISDYNGDGDFGTDADIEAFFACLGGDCCPTCFAGGSDFNGDGDFGTDADIEAFFRVLGGGAC